MDFETKRALIDQLSQASVTDGPVTINHNGQPLAIVLPIADYQQFQAERQQKLQELRRELNGILTMIRSRTQGLSLAEVEQRLATLRAKIMQELNEH